MRERRGRVGNFLSHTANLPKNRPPGEKVSLLASAWAQDRFLLPLFLGEKAGLRASNFLRQRRHLKSVRRNLSCAPAAFAILGP
jgi:hypothetical protein